MLVQGNTTLRQITQRNKVPQPDGVFPKPSVWLRSKLKTQVQPTTTSNTSLFLARWWKESSSRKMSWTTKIVASKITTGWSKKCQLRPRLSMLTKKRDTLWERNIWSLKCSQELIKTLSSRVILGQFKSKTFYSSSALLIIRLRIRTLSRASNQILVLVPMTLMLGLSSQSRREELTQLASRQTEKTCFSAVTPTQAHKSTQLLTLRSTQRTGRRTSGHSVPLSVSSQQCSKKQVRNRTFQDQVAIPHSLLSLKSLPIKR